MFKYGFTNMTGKNQTKTRHLVRLICPKRFTHIRSIQSHQEEGACTSSLVPLSDFFARSSRGGFPFPVTSGLRIKDLNINLRLDFRKAALSQCCPKCRANTDVLGEENADANVRWHPIHHPFLMTPYYALRITRHCC